jgi:hypothetical protein
MKIRTQAFVTAALLVWAAVAPCLAAESEPEGSPLVAAPALRRAGAPVPLSASVSAGEHGLHWGLSLGMPVAAPVRGNARDPLAIRPAWRVDAMFNASHDPALNAPTGGLATSLRLERATARMAAWLGVSRGGERGSRDPEARLRLGGGLSQVLGDLRGELSWVTSSVLFSDDPRWTRTWQEMVPTEKPDSFLFITRSETVSHETFWKTAQASLGWAHGRWSVDGVGGLSAGDGVNARHWAQARIGVQLSRHIGMLAAWGERPAAALAFEGNAPPRTMLGVEITPWAPALRLPHREGVAGVTGWRTQSAGPGLIVVRVKARDARAVELTGDITDWAPVALERGTGGWWAVLLRASAGVHRVQLRVDGSAWAAPPGLPRAADSENGPAGVLLVSGGE